MLKKLLTFLLSATLAISLVGCGVNTSSKPEDEPTEIKVEKSDETITVAVQSEPSTMLGISSQLSEEALNVLLHTTDRLVDYNIETNEISPMLAKEWKYTDDTHIEFKLRDDVTFVDGSKLTAKDVYYTFKTAKELIPTLDIGKYINIDETKVVDDNTIIIGLIEPLPDFLITLADTGFGIVSESAIKAAGGIEVASTSNPNVGSGKYKFKEWVKGKYILLERNENYWDKEWKGYYKNIKYTFINDSASREMAVESGDADVAAVIPISQAKPLGESGVINLSKVDIGEVSQVYFNCTGGVTGAFNDKAVREAASLVIDVNALNQILTSGEGKIAEGIIHPDSEYYSSVMTGDRKVNIEKAKKILKDAGYNGTIEVTALSQQRYLDILTVVQENLRQIGINLTISNVDTPQYVEQGRSGKYDLIYGTQTTRVRNATLFCLYDTTINSHLIGGPRYGNQELDKKIITAKTSSDKEATKKAYKEVLEEIHNEYTMVGISTGFRTHVSNPKITGLSFDQRACINVSNAHPVE